MERASQVSSLGAPTNQEATRRVTASRLAHPRRLVLLRVGEADDRNRPPGGAKSRAVCSYLRRLGNRGVELTRWRLRVFSGGVIVHRRSGFTTIELLIVIVLIGAVTVITFPKIRQTLDKTSVRAARVDVTTFAALARAAAVRRGCRGVIHFAYGA